MNERIYTIDNFKSGFYTNKEKHNNNKDWSFAGGIQKTDSENYFDGYDNSPTHHTSSYELWINLGKRFYVIGYRLVERITTTNSKG